MYQRLNNRSTKSIMVWVYDNDVKAVEKITGRTAVPNLVITHPLTGKSLQGFCVEEMYLPDFIETIERDGDQIRAYYFEEM